jgi:hypothetical protein
MKIRLSLKEVIDTYVQVFDIDLQDCKIIVHFFLNDKVPILGELLSLTSDLLLLLKG